MASGWSAWVTTSDLTAKGLLPPPPQAVARSNREKEVTAMARKAMFLFMFVTVAEPKGSVTTLGYLYLGENVRGRMMRGS